MEELPPAFVVRLLSKSADVNHLARANARDRGDKLRKQRTVVFHPVPTHMNDYDAERKISEVVLKFKSLVDGNEHVKRSLDTRQ
jgi:hypothetical protein